MFRDIKKTTLEAVRSLIPAVLAVVVLQITILRVPLDQFLFFLLGSFLVLVGIIFFLTGVKIGILPVGHDIGAELPKRGSLWFIVIAALVLGFTVTMAEPGVLVLRNMVSSASEGDPATHMVFVIASGVAVFILLSLLRILLNWDIRFLLAAAFGLIIVLSFFIPRDLLSIAFDSGGVSAGSLTVPMFLSLGLGFTSVLGRRTQFSDGFGLIGLACAGPVIGMMIWGLIFY